MCPVEGDVVQWHEDQGWEAGYTVYGIYIIEWSEDEGRFELHDPIMNDRFDLIEVDWDKIIGNIFENKDLLTVQEVDLSDDNLLNDQPLETISLDIKRKS